MLTTKPASEPQAYVVLRPFFYEGAVREVGSRVDLLPSFAAEMRAAGKVQAAPAAPAEAPAPVDKPAADAAKPAAPARAASKTAKA